MIKGKKIYLGIGGNLGKRIQNCRQALYLLDLSSAMQVTAVSSWHETVPYGMDSDLMFINGVAEAITTLEPEKIINLFLDIENQIGRNRKSQGMDRPIDIDLLYMEDVVTGYKPPNVSQRLTAVNTKENITIPHPGIVDRKFVLEPWAEIAPDLFVPVFNLTVSEMLKRLCQKEERES